MSCEEHRITIAEEAIALRNRVRVHLTVWKFKTDNIGTLIYMGEPHYMDVSWGNMIKQENKILNEKLKSYNKNISDSIWYIKNKLSSWFLTDKKNLSSFLGHYSLYDTDLSRYGHNLDCIIYPSVADGYKAANLALSPKSQNKIEMKFIYKAVLNDVTEQGVHLTRIEVGEISGEKINWLSCTN